jgi:hypothetical protein
MSSDAPDYPDAPEPIQPGQQIPWQLLMNRPNVYGPNGSMVSGRMGADGQFQAFDPSNPAFAEAMASGDMAALFGLMPNATQISESPNDAARRDIGSDYLALFRGQGEGRGTSRGGASYLPPLAQMPQRTELDLDKYRWASTRDRGDG